MKPYRFMPGGWALVLMVLLIGARVGGEEGDATAELSTFDNAAYDYWKAAALMQEILTDDQYDAVLFAENELPGLPPKAFAYRPGIGRWLLNEGLMLEALHKGATKQNCMFIREGEASLQDIQVYRGAVRRVIHRARASAKAHEFVDNSLAAGSIYADLLRMLRHMDEGGDWAAVDFTLDQLSLLLNDIAGFLSRQPPRDAVEIIVRELDATGHPRFPIQQMLAKEAQTYSNWLLENTDQLEAKIAGLYRAANLKPALSILLQLEPEEDLAQVRKWVDGYRNEMGRLGSALGLPYAEASQVIREIDRMVAEASWNETGNLLLPLLMPAMAPTYERFLAAEAHLILIEVLCKGAIYNDFVGVWPETIEVLAQFAGGELPTDPFTRRPVEYDLRGKRPRVQVDAPKTVRETGAVTEINLRLRLERDEEAVAGMIREIQREQRMEAAKAKQEEKSGKKNRDPIDAGSLRSRVNRGLVN